MGRIECQFLDGLEEGRMTGKESTAAEVLQYLRLNFEHPEAIDADTDLLDSGRLDSLRVMDLVCFLEARFRVRMQPADISPGNLRSARCIADYVFARTAFVEGQFSCARSQM
jgi:acyl carrier protein